MLNRKEELLKFIEILTKEIHQTELIVMDGDIKEVLKKLVDKLDI